MPNEFDLVSDSPDVTWDLPIGFRTTREDVAARFGGSVYSGGIVPALLSQTIFLFSDPDEGEKKGYNFDGPGPDGNSYYYTGKGV